MAAGSRVRALGALALVVGLAPSGCAINPATGKNQLMLVSEDQGIAMGRQADTAIIASIGLYPDAAWQSYIQQFGTRLAATSERPDLPWTFRVVDDPAVNAFAVPGGFVYVTRGILTHLTDEAELASVVGHEIGHVTARHSAAEMSKQQLIGAGLALGSIASATVAKYAGTASQALGILYLKYSRDDESQADQLGLRYMTRANFDPRRMPQVFRMLEQMSASEGGGQVPTWLSTHPSPGNRVDAITTQIAALPLSFSGTVVNGDRTCAGSTGRCSGPIRVRATSRAVGSSTPTCASRWSFPMDGPRRTGSRRSSPSAPGRTGSSRSPPPKGRAPTPQRGRFSRRRESRRVPRPARACTASPR